MDQPELHKEMLSWISKEFKDILNNSEQAIYIYICDEHKICNQKFASLLGYKSPEEWAAIDAPLDDVKKEDKQVLISAYQKAMEKMSGSSVNISWKNKDGKFVKTNVILVPLSYRNELFALHFLTKA